MTNDETSTEKRVLESRLASETEGFRGYQSKSRAQALARRISSSPLVRYYSVGWVAVSDTILDGDSRYTIEYGQAKKHRYGYAR